MSDNKQTEFLRINEIRLKHADIIVEFGVQSMKSSVLANAGVGAAFLALIGSSNLTKYQIGIIFENIWYFGIGFLFSVISFGVSYISQSQFANAINCINDKNINSFSSDTLYNGYMNVGIFLRNVTIGMIFLSYIFLVFEMYSIYSELRSTFM